MQMRYGPRRRPPKRRTPGGKNQTKRHRLTTVRLGACIVLLGGLTILRACFPAAAETVRETILPMMEESLDYRGAITAIGETLTGEISVLEVLGDITIWAFGTRAPEDVEVQAQAEEEAEEQERPSPQVTNPPIESIIPMPTPIPWARPASPEPDEGAAAIEIPEAVSVFLAQQEAFSQYPLPPGVSYAFIPLDIAHAAPVLGPVSSPFGFRRHPLHGDVRFHFGTDIAVDTGTPISAFAAGEVREAGKSESFGLYIVIDHGDGVITRYAHLSAIYVQAGERVVLGQTIGRTGSTGNSTGPHLHFELQIGGLYKNPAFYVSFA